MKKCILKGNKILFGIPGKCKLKSGSIIIENGIISDFVQNKTDLSKDKLIDTGNSYVLPGFIDNHTHGAIGIDISGCTLVELSDLSEFYASKGVTGFLPTLTTNFKTDLLDFISTISEYVLKQRVGAQAVGIHMEGPCINNKYRGAQSAESIADPKIKDFKDYISASQNKIKMVTIAPELKGAIDTIKYLKQSGMAVNIGHSDADFKTCIRAFENGIGCISHFLNGMRAFHQHEPSIIGAVLFRNEIFTKLICDGFHLAPDTVKVLNEVIGPERIILITDSIMATGWPDGQYDTPCFSEPLVVKNGDTQLLYSKSRAGSTITLNKAFKNFIDFTGAPIETAAQCVSINPATHLGLDTTMGSIEIGKDASFTILDDELNVVHTIVKGVSVFKS